MDKYAAEKIASEYYNLGVQLALQGAGLTKTASGEASLLRKILGGTANTASTAGLGLAGAGLGAGGAMRATHFLDGATENMQILAALLGGAAGGAKGIQQAVKMRTPEAVFQAPGLFTTGGLRLRPRA